MSSQIAEILSELAVLREQVSEVPELKARIAELECCRPAFPLPAKKGSPSLRLITLARRDPAAAKAEALRMAKMDTTNRRKAKKRGC